MYDNEGEEGLELGTEYHSVTSPREEFCCLVLAVSFHLLVKLVLRFM